MKGSRFSEEQIIGILKEHEAGVLVADLCRKHGVSDAGIYKWKAKSGGIDVSETKRLRMLEEENARLKRLLAGALIGPIQNQLKGSVSAGSGERLEEELVTLVTMYLQARQIDRGTSSIARRGD